MKQHMNQGYGPNHRSNTGHINDQRAVDRHERRKFKDAQLESVVSSLDTLSGMAVIIMIVSVIIMVTLFVIADHMPPQ